MAERWNDADGMAAEEENESADKAGDYCQVYEKISSQDDERKRVADVICYIKNSSNYSRYLIQQALPVGTPLCSYDPMVWLPQELLDILLHYLNASALLSMVKVSLAWKRYLSEHRVWRSALRRMGAEGHNYDHAREACRVQRIMCMHGAFFRLHVLPISDIYELQHCLDCVIARRDTLVCYRDDSLLLYNTSTRSQEENVILPNDITYFRLVDCSRASARTAITPKLLVCACSDGLVLTSCVPQQAGRGVLRVYSRHAGRVTSCDADIVLELVVSTGSDGYLRVFAMEEYLMLSATLLPKAALHVHILNKFERFMVVVIFTDGSFAKYSWPFHVTDTEKIKEYQNDIMRLNPYTTVINDSFLVPIIQNWPKHGYPSLMSSETMAPSYASAKNEIHTSVVHKENATMGILLRKPNEKGDSILVLDANTLLMLHRVSLLPKIVRLVGAGRRFALALTIAPHQFNSDSLVLIDLTTGNVMNSVTVPHVSTLPYVVGQVFEGEYWLDHIPLPRNYRKLPTYNEDDLLCEPVLYAACTDTHIVYVKFNLQENQDSAKKLKVKSE